LLRDTSAAGGAQASFGSAQKDEIEKKYFQTNAEYVFRL
jgi:hypothetical protein